MNNDSPKQKRVLALDPSPRGFGFAVLEGQNSLIDWGIKEARSSDRNVACLNQIKDLIARYEPDVIVVEDFAGAGSRRCARIQELISQILRLAARNQIKARSFSRSSVRKAFSGIGANTKHQIATAIAVRFPELAPRLPPHRKCWMSEDSRMSVFDAVAFGLTFFHFRHKQKSAAACYGRASCHARPGRGAGADGDAPA